MPSVTLGSSFRMSFTPRPYRKSWMTTANPLARYGAMGRRASRKGSLPPSYTTTWDTTLIDYGP